MSKRILREACQLPRGERIELAHALLDSIAAEDDGFELTAAQKVELDRRIAAHRKDPHAGIPWEQVKRRMRTWKRSAS